MILDDGSDRTFLNEAVFHELGLTSEPVQIEVYTLGTGVFTFSAMTVTLTIASCDGNFESAITVTSCPEQIM